MNKTKKMSILFATIGILAFSLIPAVSAGVPGHFKDRIWYNNLLCPFWFEYYGWEFDASDDIFFRVGWETWWEELENDWAPKWPYKFKLFINDEEINLQRFDVPVPKEDKEIVAKTSYWYHVFGPGYFTPYEVYKLRFEFWVRKPYQGDGFNHWRIYVDYYGLLTGVPGWTLTAEYDLNIVDHYVGPPPPLPP